jgi:hypothetical protein
MSLADLQRALGCLVASQSSPSAFGPEDNAALGGLELTTQESEWLGGLAGSAGLAVTGYVARWWRETKIQMMARLTVSALRRTDQKGLVDRYLDRAPCRSLFFLNEAVGFLSFVAESADAASSVRAIARFERALLEAREASSQPESAALYESEVIALPSSPETLFGALLTGASLPAPAPQPSYVEVSAGLPQLWRIIGPAPEVA